MDAVDDIKQRLSIEDVVSQYVQLKRAGSNWKGLSPFSNERSPSFMVSPEKQIWHDFSSGRGGDMFTLVMELEGVDFKGALDILARQAGIDLDQYRHNKGSGRGQEKERLYSLLDMAARFYQIQFSKHRPALEYVLQKRAFAKETALTWRIGYSPEDGQALSTYAKQKGFSDRELQAAGLVAKRYRGMGDMFRGRIMIPLMDAQGRVIGFTARLLRDDPNAPKYINTPQTLLYDKSRHVFGLHLAKETIRKSKFAVIAEGNLDVIASWQAGTAQVVATAGTALTEYQLKTLGRFTPDIRLCFDADRAGLAATERAIPLASKTGVSLSVITIPTGKDPDELIRQDRSAWESIIEKPQYALDWLIDRYKQQLDLDTAPGKRQFSDIILNVVRGLSDDVEREHYIAKLSEILQVSREALAAKLQNNIQPSKVPLKKPKNSPKITDKSIADTIRMQKNLLALALYNPSLRPSLAELHASMFLEQSAGEVFTFLEQYPQFEPENPPFPPQWQQIQEYAKLLLFIYEELYARVEPSEIQFEAKRLTVNIIDRYVKTQKQRIARELPAADDARAQQLLQAVKKLDALLKRHKGGKHA